MTMKKTFLFILTAMVACCFFSCKEKNAPNEPEQQQTGTFSVSRTKQVRFSQGNLQYQASTDTWRFAENQWDVIGDANSNISSTYSGWIDLFGWGTGNNPANTSDNYTYYTFVDWGTNAISNGGNAANQWRTLTKNEWYYLFCSRPNAAELFGFGRVNGENGTIILPDGWRTPADVAFYASTTEGMHYDGEGYYENPNDDNFSYNNYIGEEWSVMEEAGAVFLPATGCRGRGIDVDMYVWDIGSAGYYWSATPEDIYMAYGVSFSKSHLNLLHPFGNAYGLSVRLVQDVK